MREKRFLFVAMLFTALSLGFASCDNDKNLPDDPLDDDPSGSSEQTEQIEETPAKPVKVNKELIFTEKKSESKQIEVDTVKKYLAMDNIDTVFLVPVGTFFAPDYYDDPDYFKLARDAVLQELIDLSPRVRGKGDFITNLGYPSVWWRDSLWMVEQGWTVNKYWIDQLNQNTK